MTERTGGQAASVGVDPEAFRAAVSGIAGHVGIAATTLRGMDHAITVTSYTWLSVDPPLLLLCVHEDARFLDAVLETGAWGPSLLGAAGRPVADWLATPGRPVVGQLSRVPHTRGAATGVPLVGGALLSFECRTTATHPGGDHVILVGRVVGMAAREAGAEEGSAGPGRTGTHRDGAGGPLLRYFSEYRTLAG